MKNIILDTNNDKILAIACDEKTAHNIAECLSYIANTNAIYGLFGIKLATKAEIGPKASNEFCGNID